MKGSLQMCVMTLLTHVNVVRKSGIKMFVEVGLEGSADDDCAMRPLWSPQNFLRGSGNEIKFSRQKPRSQHRPPRIGNWFNAKPSIPLYATKTRRLSFESLLARTPTSNSSSSLLPHTHHPNSQKQQRPHQIRWLLLSWARDKDQALKLKVPPSSFLAQSPMANSIPCYRIVLNSNAQKTVPHLNTTNTCRR